MSCAQLLWSETAPHIDINTVTIFNAKSALCLAHYRTYTLAHWIDQMDARCRGRI